MGRKGAMAAMKKRKLLLYGLACAAAAVFAGQVRGDAADEVKRLAELMGWKAGTIAAGIGGGGGEYKVAGGGEQGGGGGKKMGGGGGGRRGGGGGGGGARREGDAGVC